MPAPVGNRGHRLAAYRQCSVDQQWGSRNGAAWHLDAGGTPPSSRACTPGSTCPGVVPQHVRETSSSSARTGSS
jgi:hypothetical protein